ncbi:MAG: STAS domain-containing protein [Cyclobacteriaceae bacterium]|nr:STAS domain-containing protein [Cyclobacteriaceae bacterium]
MIDIKNELEEEGVYLIKVSGEVDASSSIFLDQSIGEAVEKYDKILIDCEKIEYISSAGLGVFMSYINELEEKKIGLVLYGLSDKVLHVFQILGLDKLLKLVDTKSEAKEFLNGISL